MSDILTGSQLREVTPRDRRISDLCCVLSLVGLALAFRLLQTSDSSAAAGMLMVLHTVDLSLAMTFQDADRIRFFSTSRTVAFTVGSIVILSLLLIFAPSGPIDVFAIVVLTFLLWPLSMERNRLYKHGEWPKGGFPSSEGTGGYRALWNRSWRMVLILIGLMVVGAIISAAISFATMSGYYARWMTFCSIFILLNGFVVRYVSHRFPDPLKE